MRAVVILALGALLGPVAPAATEPLSALATVENKRLYAGAPFLCQVQVAGADQPEPLDLEPLRTDFEVLEVDGASRTTESLTIVNGTAARKIDRGYVFQVTLRPRRPGLLTIPPLRVREGDREVETTPVRLQVLPPSPVQGFELRQSLSRSAAYIGQPVVLTLEWRIERDVESFSFVWPALEDPRFEIIPIEPRGVSPGRRVDTFVNSRAAVGERRASRVEDRDSLTVEIKAALVAREAGRIKLPAATATFRSLGRRLGTSGRLSQLLQSGPLTAPAYESFTVPSNALDLDVRPLPEGRPADFNGLVGELRLTAEAAPRNVAVGEPLELTLRLEGSDFPAALPAPELASQRALTELFDVQTERLRGETRQGAKVFTATLRARSADAKAIPPLELAYFDTGLGAYGRLRSDAIPLEVRAVRLVTAADAEGSAPAPSAPASEAPAPVYPAATLSPERDDAWSNGGTGAVLAFTLAAPPLVWAAVWLWTRQKPPAPRPVDDLGARLAALPEDAQFWERLLPELRHCLGRRLGLPAESLTFREVGPALRLRGCDPEAIAKLHDIFRATEAARYGAGTASGAAEVKHSLLDVWEKLECGQPRQ